MKKNITVLLIALLTISSYGEDKAKTGKFTLSGIKEHSPVSHDEFADRMGWPGPDGKIFYKIEDRTFEVYVPEDYDGSKAYGLLVFISPGDGGNIFRAYENLLKKHRIIAIGANKSGNKVLPLIRTQLAIDARHIIMNKYKINPNRVYISGNSGGGRNSCLAAFTFPELFSGGIFCIGISSWQNIPLKGNSYMPSNFQKKIPSDRMKIISEQGRYAFMTGSKDYNQPETKAAFDQLFSKVMKYSEYYEVPGHGHKAIPAEWFEKAVIQLDKPLKSMAEQNFTKGQKLLASQRYAEAVTELEKAAAVDIEGAQAAIDKIYAEVKEICKQAEGFLKEDNFVKSFQLYQNIIKKYGSAASEAAAKVKEFKTDEKLNYELLADSYLMKAIYFFEKKDRANFNKNASILMKKFPDSKAAAKANERWNKKK